MDIKRIRGFIGMMSFSDKIALTGGENKIDGISRPKLESVYFGNGLLPYDVSAPTQLAVGCAFSQDVAERVALYKLSEAVENGYTFGGTVSSGLIRDPMCVTAGEFFSEDPYLTGVLLRNYAISCGIGFVFTNALGQGTFVNRTVDNRALYEIYLNPLYCSGKFAAAIQLDGGRLNGETVCESRKIYDIYSRYVYDTAAFFTQYSDYEVGPDAPMGVYRLGATKDYKLKLKKAVEAGEMQKRDLDASIERTLSAMVDAHELYKNPISVKISSAELPNLAIDSSVLLKNDGILPTHLEDIVLFGKREIFPDGNYRVYDVSEASKRAGALNVFLIAEYERDGVDEQTVAAIKTAAKTGGVVAVVCGGCATPLKFSDYANAILFVPLIPRLSDVIDIVYGIAPRGRLPFTWCKSNDDYPCNNKKFALRGDFRYESVYNGYLLFNNFNQDAIMYPFGHGLDYTSYQIDKLTLTAKGAVIHCEFKIQNCGEWDGEAVLQAYVSTESKTVYGISKRLAGVTRVFMESGQSDTVAMDIDLADIPVYDEARDEYTVLSGKYEVAIGLSSTDIRVKNDVRIAFGAKTVGGLTQAVAPSYYAVGKKFNPSAPEIEKLLKVPFIKKADDCPELALPERSAIKKQTKAATKHQPRGLHALIEYKVKTTPKKNAQRG